MCPLTACVYIEHHLQDKLVEQQLGPAPPARASPGMVMQYSSMHADRRASLLVDNVNSLIETLAGVIVKVSSAPLRTAEQSHCSMKAAVPATIWQFCCVAFACNQPAQQQRHRTKVLLVFVLAKE